MSALDLRAFSLLAGLDPEARQALALELERMEVEPGVRLFDEGDAADGLLLVASGGVRLHSRRTGSSEEVGAGAALGALSLVCEGPREVSAETLSRTRLLRLRRSAYRRLQGEAPLSACQLLEAILVENVELVRDAFERLERASIDHVPTRHYTPPAS